MKNSLLDLHNHLFTQIETLADPTLKGEALQQEIQRSRAISQVAGQLVRNSRTMLDAHQILGDGGQRGNGAAPRPLTKVLTGSGTSLPVPAAPRGNGGAVRAGRIRRHTAGAPARRGNGA